MTEHAVLYIAVGDREVYFESVVRSAQSLRRVMPDIPIAVVTDGRLINGPFDHYIQISEMEGFRAKLIGIRESPFDHTLMLDVDTYVLANLYELFELLDHFDVALAHAPGRVSMHLDDVPESFPEFNTGVIAYRRTDLVDAVLDDWLREYDELFAIAQHDQPSCLARSLGGRV